MKFDLIMGKKIYEYRVQTEEIKTQQKLKGQRFKSKTLWLSFRVSTHMLFLGHFIYEVNKLAYQTRRVEQQ